MDLTTEDRIKLAVQFISQAPPGEVNDVITDIATIIGDHDALTPHVAEALKAYNLENMVVVEHSAQDGKPASVSLLSEAHRQGERYADPSSGRTYAFDHVRLVASDYAPYALPEEDEAFRAALAASLDAYARNHYSEGCAGVSTNQVPLAQKQEDGVAEATAGVAGLSVDTLGAVEQPPTPARGEEEVTAEDEVDAPGGVEALDKEMEEEAVGAGAGDADLCVDPPSGLVEQPPTRVPGAEPATVTAQDEVNAPGGIEALDKEMAGEAAGGAGAAGAALGVDPPSGFLEKPPTRDPGAEPATMTAEDEVDAPGGVEALDEEMAAEAGKDAAEEKAEREEKEVVAEREEAKDDVEAEMEVEAEKEVEAGETTPHTPAAAAEPETPPLENPLFTLEILGHRFKPHNYWTGRWRTRWVVDRAQGTVDGSIHVDVHYYEQGNVQLRTSHTASFPIPQPAGDQSVASAIVEGIARCETNYQLEMEDVYAYMGGNAFRSLRRALPVTRQKIDWDKVQGYALGADLSRARAAA